MVTGGITTKRCCPFLLITRLLMQVAVSTASNVRKNVVIHFEPSIIRDMSEGCNQTVFLTVKVPEYMFLRERPDTKWNLSVGSLHEDIASVSDRSYQYGILDFKFDNSSRYYTLDTSFIVRGEFLGKTGVRAKFVNANWNEGSEFFNENYNDQNLPLIKSPHILDVWVKRGASSVWLNKLFVTTLIVLITLANVMMGCELDMKVVFDTVRHPVAPTIGFFTQFLIMPLLAYVIAQTLFVSRGLHSFALGIFVTGCAPGGGGSNFWTILLDGNVNLSVTMTFFSTVASLVMMPFWISLLGVHFLEGFSTSTVLRVPYVKIVSSLISLVVPLLIGVAIAKWKPNWAAKCRKVMRPFIIFTLVFVIVFGCVANSYMWRIMTKPALFGGLLLPWCGFMFGCFASILFRRPPVDVTAIAIETGIQNTGIAILMLKWSFPEPDADVSALIPVIVACFTPGPLLAGALIHKLLKKFHDNNPSETKPAAAELCPLKQLECEGIYPLVATLPNSKQPFFSA